MNSTRSTLARELTPAESVAASGGPFAAWVRFWFTPLDPVGLHAVRLLAGLLFLTWLLPLAGEVGGLVGLNGWFDRRAFVEFVQLSREQGGPAPMFSWSIYYLNNSEPTTVTVLYWLSVAAVVLFTLGVFPRLTAVLTWIAVASLTTSPVIDYEADVILTVLAFYLMVGYVLLGQRQPEQSFPTRLFGPPCLWWASRSTADSVRRPQSLGANLALRLLQVHLAVIIVTSGLHKLQYSEWWAGIAYWYPLHPAFSTTLAEARQHRDSREFYLFWLSLAAYLTLAWQLAFPLFAWRPRWRIVLLGGAVIGWLGTACLYELPLLGPAILVGCLSFLTPEEWHRGLSWLLRLPGLDRLATHWAPAQAEEPSEPAGRKDNIDTLITVGQRS